MVKKLYRSQTDKKIAGVCAGIGEYFDVDPLFIRLLFIAAFVAYGTGILAYIILWVLTPAQWKVKNYATYTEVEIINNLQKSKNSFD